jgi:hypothetical protein
MTPRFAPKSVIFRLYTHMLHVSAGLHGLEVDIERLTATKDQHERQLEREAETLRGLKAQNEQVWCTLLQQTYSALPVTAAGSSSVFQSKQNAASCDWL